MKNKHMISIRFITLSMAAIMAAVACSSNNVRYDVTGVDAPEDGTVVYLVDELTETPIDSAIVSGGTYKMEGKAEKDAFLTVNTDGYGWSFMFFNDGEPVIMNYADSTVNGSALNIKLTGCDKANTAAYAEYLALIDTIDEAFDALPEEEQDAGEEEYRAQIKVANDRYDRFFFGIIENNKDNLIPVAFMKTYRIKVGPDRFNELIESDVPYAKHPYVLEIKRRYDAYDAEEKAREKEREERKQTVIGQKFLDLEEADPDGNLHRLSEYVGQGRWVLVDFWASWCGPCKKEMPNVIAAYRKYHDMGFDVVGLSFDEEKDEWVKAIDRWDMPWIHLSDLKFFKSVAGEVYTVNSIPDNLLIDPQGTVVARGLLGEDLETKLAEIFPSD
jgi:thiol-disulfide isomerase/thioredoxin